MLVKLKKYKKRGSFLLTSILAAIVLSFIAQAIVVTATGGFGMITASRNALQAQQYATIDADALKMVDYSELDTYGPLARTAITNISESGWEHEITIGDETDIAGSDDAKQRIAKINIYKTDDTIPRFSLEVPLTSQSSGSSGEAIGTIVPRLTVNFTSTSEAGKYLYCDGSTFDTAKYPKLYAVLGTNQLPDLRNRFLEGADVGNQIIEAGLPNIIGGFSLGMNLVWPEKPHPYGACFFSGRGNGVTDFAGYGNNKYLTISFNASRYSHIYKDDINTVQPPALTVRYYIRAK